MAITYTTSIVSLEVLPSYGGLTDVVTAVNWMVLGTEEGQYAQVSGTSKLGSPDPNNFILLPNLTKTDVLSWFSDPQTPINLNYIAAELAKLLEPSIVMVTPSWGA